MQSTIPHDTALHSGIVPRIAVTLLAVAIIVPVGWRFAHVAYQQLAFPFDLCLETPNLATVKVIKGGENPYSADVYNAIPFVLTMYTPLYHYLVAFLPCDGSNPFFYGRLVSLICVLACGLLLFLQKLLRIRLPRPPFSMSIRKGRSMTRSYPLLSSKSRPDPGFTLFLVVLLFFVTEDRRGRCWWIWAWLGLAVIWANLHGGIAAAVGILGVHCASQFFGAWRQNRSFTKALWETRHLILVGIGTLLVINITPYGCDYLPYLVRAIRMERPLVHEWAPIWKGGSWTTIGFLLCSVVTGAYGVWRRGLHPIFEPLVLLLAAWLAASHVRHLSIYAVVWGCLVPAMIQGTPLGDAMERLWRNLPISLVLVWSVGGVGGVCYAVQNEFWSLQIPADPRHAPHGSPIYPVGATEYLQGNEFHGNVMVPFHAGAFVSWHLSPGVKVSNDSRYEVAYPHGVIEDIHAFYQGAPSWQATLRRYPPDAILVPRSSPIVQMLGDGLPDGHWVRIYEDPAYLLFATAEVASTLPKQAHSGMVRSGVFP